MYGRWIDPGRTEHCIFSSFIMKINSSLKISKSQCFRILIHYIEYWSGKQDDRLNSPGKQSPRPAKYTQPKFILIGKLFMLTYSIIVTKSTKIIGCVYLAGELSGHWLYFPGIFNWSSCFPDQYSVMH